MELHISEKVKKEMGAAGVLMLGRGMMERSFQKWQAGFRTRRAGCPKGLWPLRFQGKPLEGEFLVSSYVGGTFTVITTPTDQWLVLTSELEQAELLAKNAEKTAKPFAFVAQA
jgi:hypothetical protein